MPTIAIGEQDIHYTDEGSGDVLLIFPDNLHSSHAYADEVAHFADRFRVISFDYPGYGRSTRDVMYGDEREFDLWNYHADLACHLLEPLGIESCTVMGTGGGAWPALHFAGKQVHQHPLRVRGVIADSFLARVDARMLHRSLDVREHFYVRNARRLQEQHGDDWRAVVDADTAWARRLADRGGYEVPDFVLNAVACPTLLTGHLQDHMTLGIAAEYARIAGIIPNCAIHLAARSGHRHIEHPWMWSNAAEFRAVADRFLASIG
jgi:pimeloyl-ACP methyl ester carboxylesterase